MLAILVFLVRSNMSSTEIYKNYLSVFVRILMNHLQMLSLIATFDFEWPNQLSKFFQAMEPVSQSSIQILSLDCFFDKRDTLVNSNSTGKNCQNFDRFKIGSYQLPEGDILGCSPSNRNDEFLLYLENYLLNPEDQEKVWFTNCSNGSLKRSVRYRSE